MQELTSLSDAIDLVQVFRQYFRFDKNFMRTKNLAGMLKTAVVLAAKHAPINQISLPGITESDDPTVDTRLFVSTRTSGQAYDAFMTGKRSTNPTRSDLRDHDDEEVQAKSKTAKRQRAGQRAPRWARTWRSCAAKKLKMPFYFPGRSPAARST